MPSLISQMRNGYSPMPQQQQPLSDESIEWAKSMMHQVQNAANPQQALADMIQQNPQIGQISSMLKGAPGGLQGLAQQMAQMYGINLNNLIQRLQS